VAGDRSTYESHKAVHALGGLAVYEFAKVQGHPKTGLALAWGLGIAKEVYDKRHGGRFRPGDAAWTGAPATVAFSVRWEMDMELLKSRVDRMDLPQLQERLSELCGAWPKSPGALPAEHPEFKAYHRAATLHAVEKELIRGRLNGMVYHADYSPVPQKPFVAMQVAYPRLRQ